MLQIVTQKEIIIYFISLLQYDRNSLLVEREGDGDTETSPPTQTSLYIPVKAAQTEIAPLLWCAHNIADHYDSNVLFPAAHHEKGLKVGKTRKMCGFFI